MVVNSNDMRSRAYALASHDIFSDILDELYQYCSVKVNRTGAEEVLNVIELELDNSITFKIRMEEEEADNKRVDDSKRTLAENTLISYYSSILGNGVNGLASSLDEALYGYCENFKLFVDYEIIPNKEVKYSNEVINILTKFTLALCEKDKARNVSSQVADVSPAVTNGTIELDKIRIKLLTDGFNVYAGANEIKIENAESFKFTLKSFDYSVRKMSTSYLYRPETYNKIKSIMYDALVLPKQSIGSDISEIVGVYDINVTLTSFKPVRPSVLDEYDKYLDYVIMFMLQWLSNSNLSDYQGNEDNTFLYAEAMLRTKNVKKSVDLVQAVKKTSEKVKEIEFTKLDLMDFMADLNLVMKHVVSEKSYVYELLIVDILENYLRKKQIYIDVDIYNIGTMEEQREVLKEFAKVLVNNISE